MKSPKLVDFVVAIAIMLCLLLLAAWDTAPADPGPPPQLPRPGCVLVTFSHYKTEEFWLSQEVACNDSAEPDPIVLTKTH